MSAMFASKTPRDLNHDPLPFENGHGTRVAQASTPGGRCSLCVTEHTPRPQYDHVQHNAPNPILVDVRKHHAERQRMNSPKGWDYFLRVFENATRGGYPFVTTDWESITSEDHLDHARRVLTRLANLTKENT